MADLRLGPFQLDHPIARGGMGEVWRGHHVEQGVPVAVKVLTTKTARAKGADKSFATEMRAMAGLQHPGIVRLFDHGLVDAHAVRASGDRLVEGSPYMVMELATGGTLKDHKGSWTFPELESTLLGVLDALAHAHSRGVIHRDLKPANVLICTASDERPGLKLTDFGIAQTFGEGSSADEEVAGTLHYMSPEQITGQWRDYGPPTDLYALGVLAYRMASGKLPFSGRKGHELAIAQIDVEPPPLVTQEPVPQGFDDWVARLLAKQPHERFQRAADAAWALAQLKVSRRARRPDDAEDVDDEPTVSSRVLTEPLTAAHTAVTTSLHLPAALLATAVDRPPLPRDWRRDASPPPSMRVIGAGLRLYHMRPVPIVAREKERDTLWAALRAVHRTRAPRLVHLQGPAGVGKSRVVDWVCERAHEVGGAVAMVASHGPLSAPGDGVRRMVARQLMTMNLRRDEVDARITKVVGRLGELSEADRAAIVDLVAPLDDADVSEADSFVESTIDMLEETVTNVLTGVARLQTSRERYKAVCRLIGCVASDRPVIVLLENVQFAPDVLELAGILLESDVPVLVVTTARDDPFQNDDLSLARLERLLGSRRAEELELGPLPMDVHHKLVSRLLFLEGALAAQVVERTRGNPAFAVELVGDWVSRGVLKVGESGFVLAPGARAVMPEGLEAVWGDKVDRAIEGLDETASRFLQLAATLGHEVDDEEWQELCDDPEGDYTNWDPTMSPVVFSPANARLRNEIVDRLFDARLAVETELGWMFTNGLTREALLKRAQQSGRWEAVNLACARMLKRRGEQGQQHVNERLGLHLVEGARLADAFDPLLIGVTDRAYSSGFRPALAVLSQAEHVLTSLRASLADVRWGRVWVVRSALFYFRGDFESALDWAERGLLAAERYGWDEVRVDALLERARARRRLSDLDGAEADAAAALEESQELADGARIGRSLFQQAVLVRARGSAEAATELYNKARRQLTKAGDEVRAAACLRDLAALELASGEVERARDLWRRAQVVFEANGRHHDVAACLNGFAELARKAGDYAEAERGYRRALALYERVGGGQPLVPRLNLALLHLRRGDFAGAYERAEEVRAEVEGQGHVGLLAACHVINLACAASGGAWELWDNHIQEAVLLLDSSGFADADNAWAAETAGMVALQGGQRERAGDAFAIAYVQYEAVGDDAGRRRMEERLNAL